jgi:hypothetical protein
MQTYTIYTIENHVEVLDDDDDEQLRRADSLNIHGTSYMAIPFGDVAHIIMDKNGQGIRQVVSAC